jgi:hypothetical protein
MAIPYQPTFSLQPKYGFRYSAQPFAPPSAPVAAPPPAGLQGSAAAPPPVMGTQQGGQTNWQSDPFQGGSDKIPAAQRMGYTAGTQNPLGMLSAVIPGMSALQSLTGYDASQGGQYTYGNYGTYDAQGNVFGTEGRAYDPVTGAAAQSYASPGDWMGGWLGIGTPEGAFGSSSSYGKLRAAGEDIPSSFLGSYENSVYNVPRSARVLGESPASKAGVQTIGSLVSQRDYDAEEQGRFDYRDPVTARQLGFTDARPSPASPSIPELGYVRGTQTGDVFTTPGSYQTGVINQSGQIETPEGTIVSTTDQYGNKYSLLNTPEQNKRNLQTIENIATYDDSSTDDGSDFFGGTQAEETSLIDSDLSDEAFWDAFEASPSTPSSDSGSNDGGK